MTDHIHICTFQDLCPSDEELCGVLSGELPDDRVDAVLNCCETCVGCGQRIESLEASQAARESLGEQATGDTGMFVAEDGCRQLQVRLAGIEETLQHARAGNSRADTYYSPLGGDVNKKILNKVFGRYELLGEVARGGMGVVYRARQVDADRIVALKVVKSTDPDPKSLERFQAEARAAAQLDHPNIIPVYDVDQFAGEPYFTMKLIEGESLAHRLDLGPLTNCAAAELIRSVAEAIQYSHEQKILHRDIKPGNILIDMAGQPHVTDFGLAKVTDDVSELTGDGATVGTPAYMSPEQAAGNSELVDARSDVYALGAVFYACLTGRPPFQSASVAGTIMQLMSEDPIAPRQLNSEVDRDLETITLKCLEKDRAKRYASAGDIAEELQRYLDGEPILARPTGRVERLVKWTRRHPAQATTFVTASTLLLAVGTLLASFYYNELLSQSLAYTEQANVTIAQREQETAEALDEAVLANERADREAYFRNVALAKAAIDDGDFRGALAYVQDLPKSEMPWETAYLNRVVWRGHRRFLPANGLNGTLSLALNNLSTEGVFARTDEQGTVVFFDPIAGKVTRELKLAQRLYNCSFNRDLTRMIAGGFYTLRPDRIEIWDIVDGKLIDTIEVKVGQYRVAVNADLSWGVTCKLVGSVHRPEVMVIDVRQRMTNALSETESFTAIDACFDTAGDSVMMALQHRVKLSEYELRRYSLPDWQLLARESTEFGITALSLTKASDELIAVSEDQRIYRISSQSLKSIRRSDVLGYDPLDVDISDDGIRIAVAGTTGIVDEFYRSTLTRLARHFGLRFQVRKLRFAQDRMLWAAGMDHVVRGWAVGDDSEKLVVRLGGPVKCLAFSSDSKQLAIGQVDTTQIKVIDVNDGSIIHTLGSDSDSGNGHKSGVMYLTFDRADSRLISLGWDRTMCLWDLESGVSTHRVESSHTAGIQAGTMSRDRRYVFSASDDATVGVWDLEKGSFVRRLSGASQMYACAVSPDGKLLVAGGNNYSKSPMVCDLSKGAKNPKIDTSHTVAPMKSAIWSLEFSPDGKFLAIGDVFNRLWLVRSGSWESVWEQLSHLDIVHDISFSPDGSRLVSCSYGGRVILWDTNTGQEIMRLKGHKGVVRAVAFSPDGKTIATGGEDGKVMLWKTL